MQSSCVHHGRNGAATPHAWWSTQNSWHGAFQLQSCIQIVTGMRSWIRGRGVCAPATLDVKGTKRHTALCLSSPPLRESRRPGLHLDRRAADHPSSGRYVISMEPPAMKIPFSVVIPALGSNSCGLVTVRYPVCPRYLWVGLFCARNKVPHNAAPTSQKAPCISHRRAKRVSLPMGKVVIHRIREQLFWISRWEARCHRRGRAEPLATASVAMGNLHNAMP